MAENTLQQDNNPIACDVIGGDYFQRFKLISGADGVNEGDISRKKPFPVTVLPETLDFGVSPAPDIDSVASQTFSAEISCLGKSLIVIKSEASDSGGTAPVRIWTKDASGNWGPSDKITPANTGQQGGAGSVPDSVETDYYHCTMVGLEVGGATAFKIELTEAPSAGFMSLFGKAV
jgi:hypothetical protein